MRRSRRLARISVVLACSTLLIAGPGTGAANADCTGAGDFGAGSGCPPPGDTSGSGGSGESWPPTSIDWPPSQSSDSGSDSGGGNSKETPIVMPDGQTAPAKTSKGSDSTSTSTPPTPIVPVAGGSTAAANPTVIVTAGS